MTALSSQHMVVSGPERMVGPAASPMETKGIRAIKVSYAKPPLSFVKNEGQKDRAILYYEQGSGHATALTREGVSLSLARSGKAKDHTAELVTLVPLDSSPFRIEALDRKGRSIIRRVMDFADEVSTRKHGGAGSELR